MFAAVKMISIALLLAALKYWENVTFSILYQTGHDEHCQLLLNCLKMDLTKSTQYFWERIELASGTPLPAHIKNTFT